MECGGCLSLRLDYLESAELERNVGSVSSLQLPVESCESNIQRNPFHIKYLTLELTNLGHSVSQSVPSQSAL